jgi:phosphate transport system substrate-binding protein
MGKSKWTLGRGLLLAVIVTGFGCGQPSESSPVTPSATGLSGNLTIDGSTTVYPIVNFMGEDFGKANPNVKVSVTKSGTGSGFKKFIEGNLDICTASRTIEPEEDADCKAKGIEYLEIPIAYDGVSIVVNPANTAVSDLTAAELQKAWGPDSTLTKWSEIRAGFPDEKITFYGPTDNHGTYEYFTEKIAGKKNAIRKEYQPNQEYNAIVQAVAADKNGFGYMGYSYYIENKDKLKAIKIDGVEATPETIANGTYKPLSRTLFLYVNKKSLDSRPEVKAFVEYALGEGLGAVEESDYVKLPDEAYELIQNRFKALSTGSIFMKAEAGKSTLDILKAAK